MKDVAALCKRVVIIAQGRIQYDGSLSGIVDKFSGHKIVTLQFADDRIPSQLERFGELLEVEEPRARLKVPRQSVANVLAAILDQCPVEDVSVEDPPLEDVIAQMFSQVDEPQSVSTERS